MESEKEAADRQGRLSLDEISKFRAAAQQNSMDAISAAEERYQKAMKTGEPPSLEEIAKMRGAAQQNTMDAITAAEERYNKAKDSAEEKPKQ